MLPGRGRDIADTQIRHTIIMLRGLHLTGQQPRPAPRTPTEPTNGSRCPSRVRCGRAGARGTEDPGYRALCLHRMMQPRARTSPHVNSYVTRHRRVSTTPTALKSMTMCSARTTRSLARGSTAGGCAGPRSERNVRVLAQKTLSSVLRDHERASRVALSAAYASSMLSFRMILSK